LNPLQFLKSPWLIAGLEAPVLSWLAGFGVVLYTAFNLGSLWWKVRSLGREFSKATVAVGKLRRENPVRAAEGLPFQIYDSLAQALAEYPAMRRAWNRYQSEKVVRRAADGEEEVWSSVSADDIFTESAIVDSAVNRAFYVALPGMITGVGLLFTFVAILIALLDVRLVSGKVQGLELLIQGLSGKFVSSIAALFAATIFLGIEKRFWHRLSVRRNALAEGIDSLVPYLSDGRILADLSRDIAEQSTAFRSFNADLAQKLRQSFTESMGPTLVRMVTVIEELAQVLRAAEAQKQESITGSLDHLLTKLQESLTQTLDQMSRSFRESISGGAMNEFKGVNDSIEGAAKLLETMNGQFQATQNALADVVQFARASTSDQIALGNRQVEELTQVLRGLMTEMEAKAGSSVQSMGATLTAVVAALSSKVEALGDRMTASLSQSADAATGAAKDVIDRAQSWSSQSASQLADLLKAHQGQLNAMTDLRQVLDDSLGGFLSALREYRAVNADVQKVTADFAALATSLAGATKAMRETQLSAQQVAGLAAGQLEHLATASKDQQNVWQAIARSMEQYRNVFARVEEDSSKLLHQISQHLKDYVDVSQKGFEGLVTVSDQHFATATQRLAASVNELDEVLQGLSDTLTSRNGKS
jgi:hypothetical protein